MHRLFKGAVAGWIGTAPMTLIMLIGKSLLPSHEKYPLPPQQITAELARRLKIKRYLNEKKQDALALTLHFSYGALAGTGYALIDRQALLESKFNGSIAGFLLWAGSYLGWLPTFHILRPATQAPWRRNILMIIAHLVWGVTMSEVLRRLSVDRRYSWKRKSKNQFHVVRM